MGDATRPSASAQTQQGRTGGYRPGSSRRRPARHHLVARPGATRGSANESQRGEGAAMKRSLLASSVLVLAACGGGADQERPSIRVPLAASMVVFSDTSVRVDRWDLSLDLTFDGSGEVSGTCSVQPLEYICDRTDGNPCSSTGFFGSQGNVAGSRIGDALDLTLSLPPFQWTETAGAPPAPTTM